MKHLGVFEKEFEAVLFEQCCEVRYSQLERVSTLLPRRKLPVPKGSSPGGVGGGGALKRTIQHFNRNLIVDMDGEKKVLLSYKYLFSPGQTNPLAKETGKYGL